MRAPTGAVAPRGGPLLMIVLLLTGWVGGRALWWENPFAGIGIALPAPAALPLAFGPDPVDVVAAGLPGQGMNAPQAVPAPAGQHGGGMLALLGSGLSGGMDPRMAAAHQYLWRAALREPLPGRPRTGGASASDLLTSADRLATTEAAPFLPAPTRVAGDRWSLDAWAFWRQGSDAAPISQGRVPIYGASQVGAVLQYRLAPSTGRDPRLYARAYRALVRRGESEAAFGASARPLPQVPVRVAGEVRITDAAFGNEVRPSAYAVTELAPIALPLGSRLEAYGQAGWVGGEAATAFADGQASLTRTVEAVAATTDNRLRLSVGAGAWAGAQEGAHRVDLGPTMRLDLTLGEVPARLSLDWRERVGGDAGPESGLAATLSTRF